MPGKIINIPGIGEATLYKRRRMRNIRISVSRGGKVRVNLPKWVPYKAGERFAIRNRFWIEEQLANYKYPIIKDGDRVGRGAIIKIEKTSGRRTSAKVTPELIHIKTPLAIDGEVFQAKLRTACEKAMRLQAEKYLKIRIDELVKEKGFRYGRLYLKKLSSRWGSCSPKRNISLSIYMMQLPDHLIDYIILHELAHTQQMNHGPKFWDRLEQAMPGAKNIRKELRNFQPLLSPHASSANIDKEDLL